MSVKICLHAQYYNVHTLGYRKWPSRPLEVPVGLKLPQQPLVGFCMPTRTNFGRSVPVGYFSCCCTFRTSSRPYKIKSESSTPCCHLTCSCALLDPRIVHPSKVFCLIPCIPPECIVSVSFISVFSPVHPCQSVHTESVFIFS